jgi:hypothetical protein
MAGIGQNWLDLFHLWAGIGLTRLGSTRLLSEIGSTFVFEIGFDLSGIGLTCPPCPLESASAQLSIWDQLELSEIGLTIVSEIRSICPGLAWLSVQLNFLFEINLNCRRSAWLLSEIGLIFVSEIGSTCSGLAWLIHLAPLNGLQLNFLCEINLNCPRLAWLLCLRLNGLVWDWLDLSTLPPWISFNFNFPSEISLNCPRSAWSLCPRSNGLVWDWLDLSTLPPPNRLQLNFLSEISLNCLSSVWIVRDQLELSEINSNCLRLAQIVQDQLDFCSRSAWLLSEISLTFVSAIGLTCSGLAWLVHLAPPSRHQLNYPLEINLNCPRSTRIVQEKLSDFSSNCPRSAWVLFEIGLTFVCEIGLTCSGLAWFVHLSPLNWLQLNFLSEISLNCPRSTWIVRDQLHFCPRSDWLDREWLDLSTLPPELAST